MFTTTEYGTWGNRVHRHSISLESDVEGALNGEYTDDELEAITAAYREAINTALPDSVSLCGNTFYGNFYEADCADQKDYPHDEDGRLDIAAIVNSVDFWDIVVKVAGK